jgi:hypothetical protein
MSVIDDNERELRMNRPYFSRCSLGKNKWFWVTYRTFGDHLDGVIHASGIAKTAIEAEEQARASILEQFGCDCPERVPAIYALHVHHRQVVKRRANKVSMTQEASMPEFLYQDWNYPWPSAAYRIVKKTQRWVYVEDHSYSWEENGQKYTEVKTFVLDRQKLEKDGYAYRRGDWNAFYTTPYEERQKKAPRPPHLELLGVDAGCDEKTLNAAHRTLAMKMHPDHGGDPQEFKRMQVAYEMALATVRC